MSKGLFRGRVHELHALNSFSTLVILHVRPGEGILISDVPMADKGWTLIGSGGFAGLSKGLTATTLQGSYLSSVLSVTPSLRHPRNIVLL